MFPTRILKDLLARHYINNHNSDDDEEEEEEEPNTANPSFEEIH
jgi:hypothetical protein